MKKVFRLFISSTFDDFKLERAVLQRFVFSEIKRYLNEKEMNFIPIDLRWGVPTEAQEDQKTMEICLNEVNRSAEELHPDFLVMVGDRYGWVPLPEKIEENEFKEIEKYVSNKELLNKWYKLDKNQIPSSYIFQPVYEVIDKPTQKERLDIWYDEADILSEYIKSVLDKTNLTDKQKEKYYLSATHQEFLYYKNISKFKNINPENNIIGYIREITPSKFTREELTKAKFFEDLNGKELENYNNFKKEVSDLPNCYPQKIKDEEILKKEKYNLTTILTEEDIANLKDFNELPEYLKNFANEIKDKIFARIEKELQEEEKSTNFQEYYKKQILKDSLINGKLIGRSEDIRKIKELLETNNKIIISAESGTGKSVVIAKLIDELQKENENIIYRFCGVGEIKSVEQLLKDILLNEFGDKLDNEFKELLTKKEDLLQTNQEENKRRFEEIKYKFLELTSDKLIILDAIDQLEDREDELDWLPQNFIISVLNDKNYEEDSRYYRILKTFPKIKEYKLKPIQKEEDIKKIILQKLNRYNRKLTDNQLEYVLSRKDSKKPLYLTIALQELKTWRDDENNPNYNPQKENSKAILSNTQQALIKEFIQNLYTIHRNNELLVKRTFGYIYASQNHLDEELLLEVLSNDEEVMNRVSNEWHLNITGKLPDAVWARLRGEIINFLKEDSLGNIQFFHREFKKVSEEIYNHQLFLEQKFDRNIRKLFPSQKALVAHAHFLALLELEIIKSNNIISSKKNYIPFFDDDKIRLINYKDIVSHLLNYNNESIIYSYLSELLLSAIQYQNINFKRAESYYGIYLILTNKMLKLNKYHFKDEILFVIYSLGYLYLQMGNKENALILLEKILKIDKKFINNDINSLILYLNALLLLAYLYIEFEKFERAENLLSKIFIYSKKYEAKLQNEEGFIQLLIGVGELLSNLNDFNKAKEVYEKAIKFSKIKFNSDKRYDTYLIYVFAFKQFSVFLVKIGNIVEAEGKLKELLDVLNQKCKINDYICLLYKSEILNELGYVYLKFFMDFEKAQVYLEESLNIKRKLLSIYTENFQLLENYLITLNNLGNLYLTINNIKEAKKIYQELMHLMKKLFLVSKTNQKIMSNFTNIIVLNVINDDEFNEILSSNSLFEVFPIFIVEYFEKKGLPEELIEPVMTVIMEKLVKNI